MSFKIETDWMVWGDYYIPEDNKYYSLGVFANSFEEAEVRYKQMLSILMKSGVPGIRSEVAKALRVKHIEMKLAQLFENV